MCRGFAYETLVLSQTSTSVPFCHVGRRETFGRTNCPTLPSCNFGDDRVIPPWYRVLLEDIVLCLLVLLCVALDLS